MRSAAKLSYEEAQSAIDGRPNEATGPLLEPVLQPLWDAYACLKRGREAREPLELDLPERKIILAEDGSIESVVTRERFDAHRLIEECMIQANVAAAETCEKAGVPLIYRIHDAPSLEKLEALREFLRTIDINLPRTGNMRPSNFNRILARVDGTEHEHLVNEIVLRTQSQAEYAPGNIGHFGLNLKRYAHFTSPIRRYADVIVHRALIRACKLGDDGLKPEDEEVLEAIGTAISQAERRAMAAERDTVDRLVAMWLASQVGARFGGRLSGVTNAGLFVVLDDTGADGFIPVSSLGDDYYRYHEDAHALIGDRRGETFRLGDRVTVLLVEAAPLQGGLRFEIIEHAPASRATGPRGGRARKSVKGGPKSSGAARGKSKAGKQTRR
jgi:ribonuclease R